MLKKEIYKKLDIGPKNTCLFIWSVKTSNGYSNFLCLEDAREFCNQARNPEEWKIEITHVHTDLSWLKGIRYGTETEKAYSAA